MKRSCWRSCCLFQKEEAPFLLITNNYANNYVSFFLGFSCTGGTGTRSCSVVVAYFPKETHTSKTNVHTRNNYVPFSFESPRARAFACALAPPSSPGPPARPATHQPLSNQRRSYTCNYDARFGQSPWLGTTSNMTGCALRHDSSW